MTTNTKKNAPSGDGSNKASAGQKRKAHQAIEETRQPTKGEKRAKQQDVTKPGLEIADQNSSSLNQNKSANVPAT